MNPGHWQGFLHSGAEAAYKRDDAARRAKLAEADRVLVRQILTAAQESGFNPNLVASAEKALAGAGDMAVAEFLSEQGQKRARRQTLVFGWATAPATWHPIRHTGANGGAASVGPVTAASPLDWREKATWLVLPALSGEAGCYSFEAGRQARPLPQGRRVQGPGGDPGGGQQHRGLPLRRHLVREDEGLAARAGAHRRVGSSAGSYNEGNPGGDEKTSRNELFPARPLVRRHRSPGAHPAWQVGSPRGWLPDGRRKPLRAETGPWPHRPDRLHRGRGGGVAGPLTGTAAHAQEPPRERVFVLAAVGCAAEQDDGPRAALAAAAAAGAREQVRRIALSGLPAGVADLGVERTAQHRGRRRRRPTGWHRAVATTRPGSDCGTPVPATGLFCERVLRTHPVGFAPRTRRVRRRRHSRAPTPTGPPSSGPATPRHSRATGPPARRWPRNSGQVARA